MCNKKNKFEDYKSCFEAYKLKKKIKHPERK